jgi:hypothetical protein
MRLTDFRVSVRDHARMKTFYRPAPRACEKARHNGVDGAGQASRQQLDRKR